jgi:Dna[CI] antecedent, DciA
MERIGDTVGHELARSRGDSGNALAEVTAVWEAAVGEMVARQAWPLRSSRDGTLHVATASSTWAFELQRLAPEIHDRLTAVLGPLAPAKLAFRVGPIPEPGAPHAAIEAASDPLEATPEAISAAASIAAEIDDAELREIVAKTVRASLTRALSNRQI